MSEFYDIDSTKVSHKEYWDETKVLAILGWTLKWLGVRMPCSTDDPNVDSPLPFLVAALPDAIAEQFKGPIAALQALGFHSPVYQHIHDPGTQTTIYWATFLHQSGPHYARIHLRHWERAANVKRRPFPIFFTEFGDGTFLITSAGKPDLAVPSTVSLKRKTGASPEKLWALHEQRVTASARFDFTPVRSREEMLRSAERYHRQLRDFNLARGVFRPRSAESEAKAAAYTAGVEQAKASGLEFPEVMAHLNNLEEKKPSWTRALWVLLGSAILFLAAGAAMWDWKFTLWLIPVIFLHEAGHWIAMRIFKYRNLRMFFIPLFGAAVTGQSWNVPGWKKAVVSLAGPMPGILLGCVVTIAALILREPWLNQLALILLLLNGFNLLPVLPLDGGHVLQAVLFCRNRWLDGIFRILAVLGLIGLTLLGSGKLMIPLIVLMALSLPLAFKLAQVADSLRGAALLPPLPGEDRIHPQTAQTIIAALKRAVPGHTSNKMLAQQAISVFETLNARPPGVLATLALLFTHGAGVVLTVVFGLLVVINMHSSLADFFNAAIRQPEYSYSCGATETWRGGAMQSDSPTAHNLVVVTLADNARTTAAFSDLTNRLPATARLTRFGDSLFLKLPVADDDGREKWFAEFQALATNAFVCVSNSAISVSLSFVAPTANAATNLFQTLASSVSDVAGMNLIAPWSPDAQQPGFAAWLAARHDWRRISEELEDVGSDQAFAELQTKINAAQKRGALAELKRLQDESSQLWKKLREQALTRLREAPGNPLDPELIDLHVRLEQVSYTNQTERTAVLRRVAGKLGEVAYEGDEPAPGPLAYGANYGNVSQTGLLIELHWLTLRDATVGLPALAEWLCEQRCATIKYQLQPSFLNALMEGMYDPD